VIHPPSPNAGTHFCEDPSKFFCLFLHVSGNMNSKELVQMEVTKTSGWFNRLATPVVDLLTFAAYALLLKFIVNRFATQSASNMLLVTAAYLLMCAGIFIGKRLEPNPESELLPEKEGDQKVNTGKKEGCMLTLVLSWPFAAFVIVMMLLTSGFFVEGSDFGAKLEEFAGSSVLGGIIFVIVFLVILLLFPLLLLSRRKPRWKYGTRAHTLLRMFSVAAVNSMVLVTIAYWEWEMGDTEPMEISLLGKILVFSLAYVFFLMFYAPPRLALLELEPNKWSFVGYAILLGYTVAKYM
jgi:hypothetical protein